VGREARRRGGESLAMISNIHPQRRPRSIEDESPEVPFKWPVAFTRWSRRYFCARVVEFMRECRLTERNQRAFLTLCLCYAERVDAERLAAKFSRLRSPKGRRDFYALEAFVFKCVARERRLLNELGLSARLDLHQ
jgi:hypothetical protein